MRPVLAILFLVGLTAAPARAQDQPTMMQALAELIHEALPRTSSTGPDNSWDAVSIRTSRLVHWHLAAPDDGDTGEFKRRGWLAVDGHQVGVTAYGDREGVAALAFERGDHSYGSQAAPDDRALLAALAARNITVREIERRSFSGAGFPLDHVNYALSIEGRHAARFSSSTHCTPPGSRAARRCWIGHELTLDD